MRKTLRISAMLGAIGCPCMILLASALAGSGCSSSPAANAVSTAEKMAGIVSSAISAATQPAPTPTTPAAGIAAASTAINTVGGSTIVGRWVLVAEHPTPSTSVLVFERTGLFVAATRVNAQTPVVVMKGTFTAGGSALITKIGPATRTLTYKVRGQQLLLSDSRHREMVYQRK